MMRQLVNTMKGRITSRTAGLRGVLAACVAAVMMLVMPMAATAGDRVTLTTGEVIEGEIIREIEGGMIVRVMVGGLADDRILTKGQIASVERDTDTSSEITEEQVERAARGQDAEEAGGAFVPGSTRGMVVSLEGMVGVQFASHYFREKLLPVIERELGTDGSGVLVLKINSGGGFLFEIQKFSDMIHNELKPKFRVVAWIESAISAAAMNAHCIEEIYFMPQGNYGACTGFSGALVAVKGRDLVNVLQMMERISAKGGYAPEIMRAMQIESPLSYSVDDRTGEVIFYDNVTGQHVLNPEGRVFTFNSIQAAECGFSKGTASTLDELAALMGLPEIVWVGKERKGLIYPVSQAEELMIAYRETITRDQAQLNSYFQQYGMAVQAAQGTPIEDRGPLVGRARQHLGKVEAMVNRNANFALLIIGSEEDYQLWLEEQKESLRQLMR